MLAKIIWGALLSFVLLFGVLFFIGASSPKDPNSDICEMATALIKKQVQVAGDSYRPEGPCLVYPHGDVSRVRYGYSTFITRRDHLQRMQYEALIAKLDSTYYLCSWRVKTPMDAQPIEEIQSEIISTAPACVSVWGNVKSGG